MEKNGRCRRKKIRIRAPLPYLPQTILEEIFHKLSYLKDVARSKLVCSTWNSILSSPKFMDVYYNNRGPEANSSLIFFNYEKCWGNVINVGPSLSIYPSENYIEPGLTRGHTILGTYNGLVAMACGAKLILWNPLTRKCSSVCFTSSYFSCFDYRDILFCGLCYDGNKDAYHVVAAWESPYEDTIDVSLYSFKEGAEGMVDSQLESRMGFGTGAIRRGLLGQIGKVIRGLPHWAVESQEEDAKAKIFYYDLEEDEFKDIAPPLDKDSVKTLLDLTTTGEEDQLGCVVHDIIGSCFEMWVMKEYGKAESWTNLYKIKHSMEFPSFGLTKHMNVIGSMLSREVLFSLVLSIQDENKARPKRAYYAYHVGKGKLRKIKLRDVDELSQASFYTCYHKLTSPPPQMSSDINI